MNTCTGRAPCCPGAIATDAGLLGHPLPALPVLGPAGQGTTSKAPFPCHTRGTTARLTVRGPGQNSSALMAAPGKAFGTKLRPARDQPLGPCGTSHSAPALSVPRVGYTLGGLGTVLQWLPGTQQSRHGGTHRRRQRSRGHAGLSSTRARRAAAGLRAGASRRGHSRRLQTAPRVFCKWPYSPREVGTLARRGSRGSAKKGADRWGRLWFWSYLESYQPCEELRYKKSQTLSISFPIKYSSPHERGKKHF